MEPPVALRSACTGAESVVFHPPLKRYRTPFGLAKGTFVIFCPCKGSGDCARRGVPRFLRPDSRSQLLREDLIRDARVRLRPHQGAVGFVVLGLLALAGQPILFCVMRDVVALVNLRLWIHGPWPPPAGHARFQGAGGRPEVACGRDGRGSRRTGDGYCRGADGPPGPGIIPGPIIPGPIMPGAIIPGPPMARIR